MRQLATGWTELNRATYGFGVHLTRETTAGAPSRQGGPLSSESRGNSVALDQWRGLALLLVLISHGFYFTGRVHGIGRVGVNLFFFISGVLVFRSLVKARQVEAFSLMTDFWRRRLRRLYPALLAYIIAMIPIAYAFQSLPTLPHSDIRSFLRSIPWALAYTINYWPPDVPQSLGHLWSLSCEMQFYLLAPLIFLAGSGGARRRAWVWASLLAGLMASGAVGPFTFPDAKYHFEQAVWPMMLGFFCEFRKSWFQAVPAKWSSAVVWLNTVALAAALGLMLFGGGMKKVVIVAGAFVSLPCFLSYCRDQVIPGVAGRALAWLGERTYSIYLWQQPLTITGYLPAFYHPVGAAFSTVIGALWFRWFERPFLSSSRKH